MWHRPHMRAASKDQSVFEVALVNIGAVLIITCLVQACGGCSRLSESRGDPPRPAKDEKTVMGRKAVLPPCPTAPYPVLQASAPEVGHHKVFLSWNASSSSTGSSGTVVGYCLYRSQTKGAANRSATCPDCEQVTLVPVLGTRCVDSVVRDRTTYYYVAVAITSTGRTSSPTKEAIAQIPTAGRRSPAPADATFYPVCRVGAISGQEPH